jgi:DNA invertase Pin-like site-specific DNA recombinase
MADSTDFVHILVTENPCIKNGPEIGRKFRIRQGQVYREQYLDSKGMFRDAVIAILATIARQEHARLSERVVAGLRRAKRDGKVLGRKRIILDRHKVREMHAAGASLRSIVAAMDVSKSLVANILSQPASAANERHSCAGPFKGI